MCAAAGGGLLLHISPFHGPTQSGVKCGAMLGLVLRVCSPQPSLVGATVSAEAGK